MTTVQTLIAELERRAEAKRIPVRQIVRAAGINVSTWTRWKSGDTTPTFGTWERLAQKADEMLADRAA